MDIHDVAYIANLCSLIDDTLQVSDEAEVQDRDINYDDQDENYNNFIGIDSNDDHGSNE